MRIFKLLWNVWQSGKNKQTMREFQKKNIFLFHVRCTREWRGESHYLANCQVFCIWEHLGAK